ncbi:MAG TPA: Hsp20/alpha crystallin family protein [Methylomirabilota bacterium]|nr:Hsp20/alpha crystallin family protein [Methylomirabilota bacterium]
MRYRRLSHRYALVVRAEPTWSLVDFWPSHAFRLLARSHWRPDADAYETRSAVEIVVDLAGLDEDDFEVQLFEDAVVVEGWRQLPGCAEPATYHAVMIRQGPFRIELPLPAPVDAERVSARYEHGLLRLTLPKRGSGA